jgi:hypothetical protein
MTKQEIIAELEDHVCTDCTIVNLDEVYKEMLDDCYSFKGVGGPFEHMLPSLVLKEVDPTAYRCGKVDYEDSLGLVEVDGDYYEKEKVEAARDALVEEWDDEIAELEDELECDEDDLDKEDIAKNKARIAELKEAVKIANAHAF